MNNFGVYVHIPFCEHKCKYCNFCSGVQSGDIQKQYFVSLEKEIKNALPQKVSSIFFGGGTPSVVNESLITTTLDVIKQHFAVEKCAEITIECNPNTATLEKLKKYFDAGFNRISFGVQSFCDETLKILGRVHTVKQALNAVENAKNAGFQNISIDLILGVQEFERQSFEESIKKMKSLGVTHISAYILQLEENTPLFFEVKSGKTKICDDEKTVEMYYLVQDVLEKFGFRQYEISNFALKGYESKHNLNYWQCGEYFGFGISAHSYFNNERSENTSNLQKYIKNPLCEKENKEVLTQKERIEELIMLSLRLRSGLDLGKLKTLGCDLMQEKEQLINSYIKDGILKKNGNKIVIAKKFITLSNEIITNLI